MHALDGFCRRQLWHCSETTCSDHGGHRQLNAAIYRTVIARMRFHQLTIDYVARRTAEGKSKRDSIRCLKRYVIREIYQLVKANPKTGEIMG